MEQIEKVWAKGTQTERLYLRKLKLEDVNDMYEYTSDEANCKYLKWDAHRNKIQTEKFIIEKIQSKPIRDILWGIELKNEKKLIGVIRIYNLDNEKSSSEISYILNNKYSGNGYMSEAVLKCQEIIKLLGLKELHAYFVKENIASEKVMQRCGLEKDVNFCEKDVIKGKSVLLNRYIKKFRS